MSGILSSSRKVAFFAVSITLLVAVMVPTAAAQYEAAPIATVQGAPSRDETTPSTTFRAGSAIVNIRAHRNGHVFIAAQSRGSRVSGWFEPAAMDEWITQAEALLDAQSRQHLEPVVTPSRGLVEYISPLLFAANSSALIFDRVLTGAGGDYNLFVSDREGAHRMYISLSAPGAEQLFQALSDAATLSRQLASAAAEAAAAAAPASGS
ncbi:MAG: hypothetical protein ACRENI_11490 [Gemmatimonadaceae bacterium]